MSQRQITTPVASSEKALEAARDLFLVQGSGTYQRPCRSLHWAFNQVNSNLSTGVLVNLDYLLLAAVEKRELVDNK